MNKRGFVLSTYVYMLLVFFLLLLGTMLAVLNNSKLLSNKLKEQSGSTSGLLDNEYSFILLGDKEINVIKDTEYEEPGYIAKTTKGVDISTHVSVIGNVDTSVETEYTLTYKITYNGVSRVLKRIINIVKPIVEFAYTGDYQVYEVPATGYYKVELWGAQGGSYSTTYPGGLGGSISATIHLQKNEKIYVYVGGKGDDSSPGNGGYNGGGNGALGGTAYKGYPGGGATDIRYFGDNTPSASDLIWNSTLGINSRIMVAAGGGGSGWHSNPYYSIGGSAGGLIGFAGTSTHSSSNNLSNAGATQTKGGYNSYTAGLESAVSGGFGYGGAGTRGSGYGNSGGGSGYYGGSGGPEGLQPGAGGSSFISGYAGVNAITSSTDRTHTNNTLHYSNKYFIDGEMKEGINSGDGKAKITYVGKEYEKQNTKLNNVRYIKDCINGNTSNSYNEWTELQAINNGINIAHNKNISGTGTIQTSWGTGVYTNIVDGVFNFVGGDYTSVSPGLYCITVDLDETYDLDEIAVWHMPNGTSYNNHSLYVSPDNTNWTTLIDNVSGVVETSNGIRVSAYH